MSLVRLRQIRSGQLGQVTSDKVRSVRSGQMRSNEVRPGQEVVDLLCIHGL